MVDHPSAATRPGGGRQALSPAMRAFLVVDVILVLTFLLLGGMRLLAAPGEVEAEAPVVTQPEPETQPDETPPAAPDAAEAVTTFQMPSGNIFCVMTETSAECSIVAFSYTAPDPPADCQGTVGSVLRVAAGEEGTMPCVEAAPTAAPDGTPVLEYGQASTVGEMTCQSNESGVYCQHDPTSNGFSVARAGYRFF